MRHIKNIADKSSRAFENLEMYFSNISSKLEEYEIEGPILTGVTNDGRKVMYNSFTNDLRIIPYDPENMTDEEYRSEFGFRLRNLMTREGINQTELAARTGVSQTTISGYLNAKKMPSYGSAAKIARVLNCSLDDFVYRG